MILLRQTPAGVRAFPIDRDGLEALLDAGCAKKVSGVIYRETEPPALPNAVEVVDDQVYKTREMRAEKPAAAPRRRGRPRKVVVEAAGDEELE